jgi:bidirectional [NiFe] hydrogenase diaphorase subunit
VGPAHPSIEIRAPITERTGAPSLTARRRLMPIPYRKPAAPSDDKRWKIVETRMRRLGDRPLALIEALHAAQEAFGFLDTDALEFIGDTLGVPHSRVYGVATFYSFFTLKPQGDHTCVVCTGTACYINGAKEILAGLDRGLGIKPRETTADGKVSLLTARCIGACSLAPAVIVDGDISGKVKANELVAQLEAM